MVITLVLYMRHAAEEAVESFRMLCRMAREKFALLMLSEFIVFGLDFVHFITLHNISGHGNRVRALIIVPFILFVNYL